MTVKEAVKAEWWPKAIDLILGLRKRPQPGVPHIPAGPVLDELKRVQKWVLWKYAGGKAPRPPGLWRRVPDYAWAGLTRYLKAHPHPKPKPGEPPAEEKPAVPLDRCWTQPTFCSTWGLTSGQWTPDELAGLCARYRVALCFQLIPENMPYAGDVRRACQDHGVFYGGWATVNQQAQGEAELEAMLDRVAASGVACFAANIESRWALGGTTSAEDPSNGCHKRFASAFRKRFPEAPAIVQTNFGGHEARDASGKVIGYDRDVAAIYEAQGFRCQVEAYTNEQPNVHIDDYLFTCHQAGYTPPYSTLIGIYETAHGEFPVSFYAPDLKAAGREYIEWVYDLEQATEADLVAASKPL
jgi:hypothetical protein